MTGLPARRLTVGVSPYHLTARAPAAFAALWLGDAVMALVPSPPGAPDRASARRAAGRVPRFVELASAWEWSLPLWRTGVIASASGEVDPAFLVSRVVHDIVEREEYAALRPYLRHALEDERWLDAVAHDLLRGGPNPGMVVPVVAALDRACVACDAVSVRSDPQSLAEKAEHRGAERVFRAAMPMVVACSGERAEEVRETLAPELGAIRAEINAALDRGVEPERAPFDAYADAFESARAELMRSEEEGELPPVRTATVALEGVRLPADAALRSSVAAACAVGAVGSGAGDAGGVSFDPVSDERPLRALIVRVVGRRAAPSR